MPVLKCISNRKADVSYTVPHPHLRNNGAQVATETAIPDLYKDATIYRFQHNEEQFVLDSDASFILNRWPKEFVIVTTETDTPDQQLLQSEPYDPSTDTYASLRKEKQRNDEFWRTHEYIDGEVIQVPPAQIDYADPQHPDVFVTSTFDVPNIITPLLTARTDEELTNAHNDAMKQLTQSPKRKPGRPRNQG